MPTYSRKISKPVYIPTKLKSIVEGFSKTDKRNTILIYKTIENLHKRDNVPLNYFDEIPVKYLKKKVYRYSQYIKILEDNGIIERTEDYSFGKKKQCFAYRILDECLDEFKLTSYSELPNDKDDILSEAKREQIRKTLDRCKVDKDAAYDWIDLYCQELSIEDFNFNYRINFDYVNLKLFHKTVRISLQKAIMDAMAEEKVIVNTQGQDCLMVDADDFIQQKRLELSQEYKQQVDSFKRGIYSISRSPVNYRVNHPLTNLKKNLFQFITMDGQELVNVDIKNSQLAILSNVIENKIDYESGWQFPDVEFTDSDYQFLQMCKNGQIYEYIAQKIGFKNRDEAKKATFGMLFAHYGKMSPELIELKREFSGIIRWIDQFKRLNNRLNGEKHFSTLPLYLQRVESKLVVDEIWDKIPEGTPFVTVHDSFVTTKGNSQTFQNLITQKIDCKVAA